MSLTSSVRKTAALLLISCILIPSIHASSTAREPIAGFIQLEGGKVEHFTDVISLVFSLPEGAESIPQNVNEWPAVYETQTVARSAPLVWLRSIAVGKHETKPGYRCLFNPVLSIETVSGVVIESQFKTLEWIRVKTAAGEERTFYFAQGEKIQIRKIVFKSK